MSPTTRTAITCLLPRTSVVGAAAVAAAIAVTAVSAVSSFNNVGGDGGKSNNISVSRLLTHWEGFRAPITTLAAPASISSPASSVSSIKEGCRSSFKETIQRMYPSETEPRADGRRSTTAVHVTGRYGKSQVVYLLSAAFAGNSKQAPGPILAWALPAFVDPTFIPNDPRLFDTPDWYKLVGLMMRLIAADSTAKDGVVIAIPNDDEHEQQQEEEEDTVAEKNNKNKKKDAFKAVVLIELYDLAKTEGYQKIREDLAAIKSLVGSFVRGSMPSAFYNIHPLVDFLTVLERQDQRMKEIHRQVGPSTPHIYVHAVAVNPTMQGQGWGKRIMGEISNVADELQLPCFLECAGSRNRAVYEKSGYQVVGTIEWAAKDIYGPTRTEEGNIDDITLYLMVRDPKSPRQQR